MTVQFQYRHSRERAINNVSSYDHQHLLMMDPHRVSLLQTRGFVCVYLYMYLKISIYRSALRGAVCVMNLALSSSGSFHGYQWKLWRRKRIRLWWWFVILKVLCHSHAEGTMNGNTTVSQVFGTENDVKQLNCLHLSVLFVFQSKNEAFAWALIGVSVTVLKHSLISASTLTSSYAGVCAVLTLTHQLLVQRTTDSLQFCSEQRVMAQPHIVIIEC